MTAQYVIRNYQASDARQVANINYISMLAYQFNRDYEHDRIFCAVNEKEELLAVGHVVPDQTFGSILAVDKPSDFVYKLLLDITVNESLPLTDGMLDTLFQALVEKARAIRAEFPSKRIVLSYTTESTEVEEIEFFLKKGFVVHQNHLVMKRDLTQPIQLVPTPEGIEIRNWKMETIEEQERYLAAEKAGDRMGVSWSLNHLQWTKSGAEWDTFTAFSGEEVVGSVMTWGLGEHRGATENIFVLEPYQRKGIAKALISTALVFLRETGKTEATLGVFGDNHEAIPLYLSLGYRMYFTMIELGMEL